MKNNNIKIAIVETGNFYHQVLGNQILELCSEKKLKNLKWVIRNFEDSKELIDQNKLGYQIIIIDNYFKNNTYQISAHEQDFIDELKEKNKNCMFISISGSREMLITGEHLSEGKTTYFYSKQTSNKHTSYKESGSIPSIYKLVNHFLDNMIQNISQLTLMASA